jgi:hypothetical protein
VINPLLSGVKKVVWTSTSDPALLHDSPTPEASCRATCDKLPVFNPTTLLLTTTHHKNTSNPHTDQSTLPKFTPNRSTYLSTHHTQHSPHNGPSKGVPRDAARVRQGRPPVHHQVQQAYVFTLSLLAKQAEETIAKEHSVRWALCLVHSRQAATSRTCPSFSSTSTLAHIEPRTTT